MKKYSRIVMVTMLSVVITFSCKKDGTPKDYAASISNKTWWGTITYTGKAAEYYSIHFKADSSLLWTEEFGDFAGKWALNGKHLTMTFSVAKIEADISPDDKLVNFTDNANTYDVNTGQLIADPMLTLDNTTWSGSIVNSGTSAPLQLIFMPNSRARAKLETFSEFSSAPYTRSASGAVIRYASANPDASFINLFCVVTSATNIKGTVIPNTPFQLTKQ